MLKIASWNATSLVTRERRRDLEEQFNRGGFEVMLVQETRLGEKHNLRVSGARTLRNDDGVGTAIVVADRIKTEKVIIEGLSHITCTAARIWIGSRTTLLVSLYVPCILPR